MATSRAGTRSSDSTPESSVRASPVGSSSRAMAPRKLMATSSVKGYSSESVSTTPTAPATVCRVTLPTPDPPAPSARPHEGSSTPSVGPSVDGAADGRGNAVGGTPQQGGEDAAGGHEARDVGARHVRDHRRVGTGTAHQCLGGAADGDEGDRKGVHVVLQGSANFCTATVRRRTLAVKSAAGTCGTSVDDGAPSVSPRVARGSRQWRSATTGSGRFAGSTCPGRAWPGGTRPSR